MNWLLDIVMAGNVKQLQMTINNSSSEKLAKMLEEHIEYEGIAHNNAMHLMAKLYDSDGFYELIEKLPEELLAQHILSKNSWGMNPLLVALIYQRRDEATLLLLQKLPSALISQALMATDTYGFNGFRAALEYQQQSVVNCIFDEPFREAFLACWDSRGPDEDNLVCKVINKAPAEVVLKILSWLPEEILESAISSLDKYKWNGLHFAAANGNNEIAIYLCERLAAGTLSHLATQVNDVGANYLHFLFANSGKDPSRDFIKKLSPQTLATALQQVDNQLRTPYWQSLLNQEEEINIELTSVLTDEQLNKIFKITPKDGWDCLMILAYMHQEGLFLDLAVRLDRDIVIKSLRNFDPLNRSLLLASAERFSSNTVQWLIELSDSATINSNLRRSLKTNQFYGWNLLNLIVRFHSGETTEKLVAKANQADLEHAVISGCMNEDDYGLTALHQLFHFKDKIAITAVLDKISNETLNKGLLAVNRYGWSAFQVAMWNPPDIVNKLIARATADTLESAFLVPLSDPHSRGTNLLHQLLFNQTLEEIQLACEKVNPEILEKAFLMQLEYQEKMHFNALMIMTYHCNNEVVQYFLDKISRPTLAKACRVRSNDGTNALHFAANFLRAETVLSLCEKLSDKDLNDIITEPGDLIGGSNLTPLQIIFSQQFPIVGHTILPRLTAETLRKAAQIKSSLGFSLLDTIISLYDYETIKRVIDNLDDLTLRNVLDKTHKHYYQMLIGNTALTNETGMLILQELERRVESR